LPRLLIALLTRVVSLPYRPLEWIADEVALRWKIDLKPASVSGWRPEQAECRRRDDFRNGAGTQRRRQPLTEADAAAFSTFRARDERAGNDEGGPERY